MRTLHATLEVVGHHGRRHSAKELQCLHVRGKPVSERLSDWVRVAQM
jgi:hypothetical protein